MEDLENKEIKSLKVLKTRSRNSSNASSLTELHPEWLNRSLYNQIVNTPIETLSRNRKTKVKSQEETGSEMKLKGNNKSSAQRQTRSRSKSGGSKSTTPSSTSTPLRAKTTPNNQTKKKSTTPKPKSTSKKQEEESMAMSNTSGELSYNSSDQENGLKTLLNEMKKKAALKSKPKVILKRLPKSSYDSKPKPMKMPVDIMTEDEDSDFEIPSNKIQNLDSLTKDEDLFIPFPPNETFNEKKHEEIPIIRPHCELPAFEKDNSNICNSNPESYFMASNRLKYRKEDKSTGKDVPNDSKKGIAKKPRKGTRGLAGASKSSQNNLPTRPSRFNFSVSKEASRAASDWKTNDGAGGGSADSSIIEQTNDHLEEIEYQLKNKIEPEFPQWINFMNEGFNIMLYGFGSKIPVFQEFKSFLDDNWLVVSINGLYPKLNARSFLTDLCDSLDMEKKIKISGTNVELIAVEVSKELINLEHPDVFLLIMHLDSLILNHPSLLVVLCFLAKVKWIHILASCDKVNATIGITQGQSTNLNFCWISCTTFQPYRDELTWASGIYGEEMTNGGGKLTLQYVLKSLTGNARKAFTLLASLQLASIQGINGGKGFDNSSKHCKTDSEKPGVEFKELARQCRESFIANSDAALRTLLVEFIDHKLISYQGKNKSVGNVLSIDLDYGSLKEISKGL